MGLRVVPLAHRKALRGERRRTKDTAGRAERPAEEPASTPQVWISGIGEVDPADPPPWV